MLQESNKEYNTKLQAAYSRNLAEIDKRKTVAFNLSFDEKSNEGHSV